MPKTAVAMFISKQEGGRRTYTLMTKNGEVRDRITVMDAGQGAARAHELANVNFQVSSADWAYQLARKYEV